MKILVIQLARLGDIYMSWPALRALRRKHPEAEIHVLTRPRFASAFAGLTAVHKVIHLPTQDIIAPLLQAQMDIQGSFNKVDNLVEELRREAYHQIINFSFSPVSSYLTHAISSAETQVCGYTRYQDGFLSIPDDMSAYFYAQVGVGRANRFHLVEIFASLIAMDLIAEDFRPPHPFPSTDKVFPADYLVVHIGASETHKVLSVQKWISLLQDFQKINAMPLVLIGSDLEKGIAAEIQQALPQGVINQVGQTQLQELFPILKGARLLLGCDSVPMHMATLTGTPCVNISFATVNFWETGPRAMESIVIRARNENDLSNEKTINAIQRSLVGQKQDLNIVHVVAGIPSYWTLTPKSADFDWLFLRAIYLGEDFPSNEESNFKQAIEQLSEINQLMLQQMEVVQRTDDVARAAPFIERGEEIIETIGKLVPATQVLVRWYQTEKIRIAPAEMKTILQETMRVHLLFQRILNMYSGTFHEVEKELA